jgi:hypothetical protein
LSTASTSGGVGEVEDLVKACAVNQERATDELGTDAGSATAATAAAVATGLASGSRSGLGPVRRAAQPVRGAALGVHALAKSASVRSCAGFAATIVLLAVGAGTVAAKLLGGNVPDAVLVLGLAVLAAVAFTGLTVGFPIVGRVVAFVIGAVALAYVDPDRVCPVFPADGCGAGQPQPEWKEPMANIRATRVRWNCSTSSASGSASASHRSSM